VVAMPGRFLSLRSPVIWFKDASLVATELSRDWRNAGAVNLWDLRMINRVWFAMSSRSDKLSPEQPTVTAFDLPRLLARLPCQVLIEIILSELLKINPLCTILT
jgi:hypothetical protein